MNTYEITQDNRQDLVVNADCFYISDSGHAIFSTIDNHITQAILVLSPKVYDKIKLKL